MTTALKRTPPPPGLRIEGGSRLRGVRKTSSSGKPLLSVITVVFNGVRLLEETIQSVLDQHYPNIEYILIDGGSTDGTIDIIRKYEGRIDFWVSEPDRGIYDAMNKGIAAATGQLIGVLNSDDRYLPGALEEIARAYSEGGNPNAVIAGPWKVAFRNQELGTIHPSLKFHDLRICHQAMFVPQSVYHRIGPYDTSYRYSADLDMALRLFTGGFDFIFVEQPVVIYRAFGASGTNFRTTGREQSKIIKKYLPLRSWIRFQAFRLKSETMIAAFLAIQKTLGEDIASRCATRYFSWKGTFRT